MEAVRFSIVGWSNGSSVAVALNSLDSISRLQNILAHSTFSRNVLIQFAKKNFLAKNVVADWFCQLEVTYRGDFASVRIKV